MISHSFITVKITATNQDELFDKFRLLLVFIKLNICYFSSLFLYTKKKTEPSTCPARTTAPAPTTKEEEATESMGYALDTSKRGCHRILLDELITTDIPGCQNFIRMPPAFFDLIEERINNCLKKSHTNFRKPL